MGLGIGDSGSEHGLAKDSGFDMYMCCRVLS